MYKEEYQDYLFIHIMRYPYLKFPDIYKFLMQAVCGNAHFIEDKDKFRKDLEKEINILKENLDKYLNYTGKDFICDNLIEHLSETYVRVNLLPYLNKGYDIDILSESFLISAENSLKNIEQSKNKFKSIWNEFTQDVYTKTFIKDLIEFINRNFNIDSEQKNLEMKDIFENPKFYLDNQRFYIDRNLIDLIKNRKIEKFFEINLSWLSLDQLNYFIKANNYPVIHHDEQYLSLYKPSYRVVMLDVLKSKLKK